MTDSDGNITLAGAILSHPMVVQHEMLRALGIGRDHPTVPFRDPCRATWGSWDTTEARLPRAGSLRPLKTTPGGIRRASRVLPCERPGDAHVVVPAENLRSEGLGIIPIKHGEGGPGPGRDGAVERGGDSHPGPAVVIEKAAAER